MYSEKTFTSLIQFLSEDGMLEFAGICLLGAVVVCTITIFILFYSDKNEGAKSVIYLFLPIFAKGYRKEDLTPEDMKKITSIKAVLVVFAFVGGIPIFMIIMNVIVWLLI